MFYDKGLYFTCKQCSHCCRDFPGVVLLSEEDLQSLVSWSGLTREQFMQVYCRWVEDRSGKTYLSLKERQNYDCILWQDGGCTAYKARPTQCRTYPFWKQNLESQEAWDECAKGCPGMNSGELHSKEEITSELEKYMKREVISD